jgi:DNA-binding transcriptional ArsR family regulator
MLSHETAGVALAPQQRRNLPNRILRAFDAAKHIDGLTKSLRAALAELVRYVPQAEPFATIFAHKANIASRLGVTERTLYRYLDGLKTAGLIEVLPQERKSRNGRYAVARIRLTRQAAELVGLIEQNPDVIHTSPSDNLSGGHTVSEPTIAKRQRQGAPSGAIPTDLAHLTGQGLSKAGLFKLMGKAKAKGKLLSDIVAATGKKLDELKGGRLYAYLAALACGPTDFSVAAAQARQRQLAEAEAAQLRTRLARFKTRFAGALLANRTGDTLYRIDRNAQFVETLQNGRRGTAPLNELHPWMEAVERGRLVLATAAVEHRFGLR